jgi:hypothetical protein
MKPSTALFLTVTIAALLLGKMAFAQEDALVCGEETARQEKAQAIPDRLLHAISLVESGRWDDTRKANLAWPWTVMAEGEGRFLPSKQAAIAEVQKLRAKGVKNIDVGCMQVNLLAHPDAFASLEEAFEPRNNVGYAARFLNELHEQAGSWPQAGAWYHSQTPELAAPYKAKLMQVWDASLHHQPSVQLASLDEPRMPLGFSFPAATAPHREENKLAQSEMEKVAARKAADSYRQAKLAEYRQKHPLS